MGSVWLIWLDFDLKVDSNTGGGGGREEEGSGELYEAKFSVSVARFVQYSSQATQIPKGAIEINYTWRTKVLKIEK